MKYLLRAAMVLVCAPLVVFANASLADGLLMARSKMPFPEAMTTLQQAIINQGYTLSRVQRVDIGLQKSGYVTDKYRIVFFGKPEEIKNISDEHPELIPYLPLKIAIFAEAEQTMVVVLDPIVLHKNYPDSQLQKIFLKWEKDLSEILDVVRLEE